LGTSCGRKIIEHWYAIGSEYASNPTEIDRKIENSLPTDRQLPG
jgi:hypothetical protein